jgi:hypothetical protein
VHLEILPEKDSVIIRYETKSNVRSVIRWGKTISYELGSLAERSFSRFHETRITGLTPGTTYKFDIFAEHSLGISGTLIESTFTTLPPEDIFPPGNVQNLRAVIDGSDIVLSWVNPTDSDFDTVRILRSDRFYPSDLADGWVVYEGDGDTVRDSGTAIPGTRQYYTVFTYDALGNVSSGAVVMIRVGSDGGTVTPTTTPIDTTNTIALKISDIEFIQEGIRIEPQGSTISIDGGKHLTISLPYNLVPEHLKTIMVTLDAPHEIDGTFMFLLRVNRDKTAYTAILAPLGIDGTFPMRISVFDYTTEQIGYTQGVIKSTITYMPHRDDDGATFLGYLFMFFTDSTWGYLLWFIVLLILLTLWARRLFHAQW